LNCSSLMASLKQMLPFILFLCLWLLTL
jgi:hypothetical protein